MLDVMTSASARLECQKPLGKTRVSRSKRPSHQEILEMVHLKKGMSCNTSGKKLVKHAELIGRFVCACLFLNSTIQ